MAAGALEHVDLENALHELGPGVVPRGTRAAGCHGLPVGRCGSLYPGCRRWPSRSATCEFACALSPIGGPGPEVGGLGCLAALGSARAASVRGASRRLGRHRHHLRAVLRSRCEHTVVTHRVEPRRARRRNYPRFRGSSVREWAICLLRPPHPNGSNRPILPRQAPQATGISTAAPARGRTDPWVPCSPGQAGGRYTAR